MANDSMTPQDDISPEISDLYRQGATETPPEALDDAILRRARIHCPPPQTSGHSSWARRWRWPLSTAVSVVVVATVLLLNSNGYQSYLPGYLPAPEARFDDGAKAPAVAPRSSIAADSAPSQTSSPAVDMRRPVATLETQAAPAPSMAGDAAPRVEEPQALRKQAVPQAVGISIKRQGTFDTSSSGHAPAAPQPVIEAEPDHAADSTGAPTFQQGRQGIPPLLEKRLADVDRLLARGEQSRAVELLRNLRRDYPRWPLPARYRQLLENAPAKDNK